MEIGSSKNLTPSVNELSSEVLEAGLASICGLSSRRVVAVWTDEAGCNQILQSLSHLSEVGKGQGKKSTHEGKGRHV